MNAFEGMDKAKITYLETGVFGDCRSMTNDFVNGVLTNYAANGGKKIPAYLFLAATDKMDMMERIRIKCLFFYRFEYSCTVY